jgi:hypothetical protein
MSDTDDFDLVLRLIDADQVWLDCRAFLQDYIPSDNLVHLQDDPLTLLTLYTLYALHHISIKMIELTAISKKYKLVK